MILILLSLILSGEQNATAAEKPQRLTMPAQILHLEFKKAPLAETCEITLGRGGLSTYIQADLPIVPAPWARFFLGSAIIDATDLPLKKGWSKIVADGRVRYSYDGQVLTKESNYSDAKVIEIVKIAVDPDLQLIVNWEYQTTRDGSEESHIICQPVSM